MLYIRYFAPMIEYFGLFLVKSAKRQIIEMWDGQFSCHIFLVGLTTGNPPSSLTVTPFPSPHPRGGHFGFSVSSRKQNNPRSGLARDFHDPLLRILTQNQLQAQHQLQFRFRFRFRLPSLHISGPPPHLPSLFLLPAKTGFWGKKQKSHGTCSERASRNRENAKGRGGVARDGDTCWACTAGFAQNEEV